MSPQPLTSPLACIEAPALEAVAAFLAECGLERAAEAVRDETRAVQSTGGLADDPAVFAASMRQLAAAFLQIVGGAEGGGNAFHSGPASKESCRARGKENVGPAAAGEEEWLDGVLEKLAARASCPHDGSIAADKALPVEVIVEPSVKDVSGGENNAAALKEAEPGAVEAEGTPAAQPPVAEPLPPPLAEPSEAYRASRPGAPLEDGMHDEYRDDGDAGYRVLHVSEVELLAELQEKYQAVLEVASSAGQTSGMGAAGLGAPSLSGIACSAGTGTSESGNGLAAAASAVLSSPDADATAPAADASMQLYTALDETGECGAGQAPEARQGAGAAQAAAAEAATWAVQGGAVAQWQSTAPHVLASSRKARHGSKRPAYRYAPSGDPFFPAECDGVIFDSFTLRVVYERDRTGFEESKEFPIQMNSIIAARYQVLNYLGSAAFSRAVQCLDLHTGEMVCMKIIKNDKEFIDQSLDEIKLLKIINANVNNIDDVHCLRLVDYIYHKEHLIIITELLRDNLYEFSKFNRERGQEPYFTLGHLQRITAQLLKSLEYIHGLWLIHADLKPENVLIKSYSRCEVKLIDFGSSCFVDDVLSTYVQSRSYRAPEVILGLPYDQKVDLWSLGCVLAELWTGYVLFQNDSVQSLLARVVGIIGPIPRAMMAAGRFVPQYFTQDGRLYREIPVSPEEAASTPPELQQRIQLLLPKRSSLRQRMRTDDEEFLDLLACLLRVDPAERPTAKEALEHPWLAAGRYTDGL
mmetsp:Transcript_68350/g.193685  ORF Transcript_68350/g.193685 Transcript_68350/m.193685 type:complete len:753 (+) Transcript_68350:41-2299(+)